MNSFKLLVAVTALVGATLILVSCGGSSDEVAPDPGSQPASAAPEPANEPSAAQDSEPVPQPQADPAPAEPPDTPAPAPDAPAEPPAPSLPEGLPEDIAGYEDWVRLNAEPIPPIEGGDPHLGTKDVFTSLDADRSGERLSYPDGTIIVKQATRPDRDFIGLIAIMRKIAGFDPDNNDWEFVEYARDEPEDAFSILASGSVCSSCHMNAAGTDYVWVHATGAAP